MTVCVILVCTNRYLTKLFNVNDFFEIYIIDLILVYENLEILSALLTIKISV